MQLACIASAFWVALTRVKDHMHHPGDVIAGAIVGTLIQVSKQRMLRESLAMILTITIKESSLTFGKLGES